MNEQEYRERKARSRRRWIFLTIIAFGIFPPAGVGLVIANALDILPNIGGKLDLSRINADLNRSEPQVWRKDAEPSRAIAPQKGMPRGGILFSILGWIAAGIGSIASLARLITCLRDGFTFSGIFSLGLGLSLLAGGLVTALFGHIRKKKAKRFADYLKLIGDKTAVPVHYLADVMGIDYHKVLKDLREMITRGILDPAWLDMKTYRLMLTEYSEAQITQPTEKKEEAISRSERILRQIRADNDLIADQEVSRKIDRIEDLTRKIFAILDERPEKETQLYSFLNYYLPTTLKALENYARLEAQGIETASIREAKEKITKMLDELADGYEKQLDRLFENDVVDISADIEVMRQMLRKDGLTEDEIVAATAKK